MKRGAGSTAGLGHPMDVMRTGVSVLGCVLPEKDDHNHPGARDIADQLMACARLDAAVLVSLQPQRPAHRCRNRRRHDRRPFPAPAASARSRAASWVKAMHTSLILYAEHEFNARPSPAASSPAPAATCTRASPAASARCAGRSTAAPTKSRSKCRSATKRRMKPRPTSGARRAQGSRHRLRPSRSTPSAIRATR